MTTNLKHRADRKQEYETVVFQKNRYKVLTCVNPFEQNNDHTRISHEIEFQSSFKKVVSFMKSFLAIEITCSIAVNGELEFTPGPQCAYIFSIILLISLKYILLPPLLS